jgi:SAM-dependent methyltransferase
MPNDTDELLRGINATIAGAYDRVPYDPPASPGLDPKEVFALAARYLGPRESFAIDVLDLGCGTGAQLERVADLTAGRLVGTDLSDSACTMARNRTARFGARCSVICADFMNLEADELGAFDLVYLIGVVYVTPPQVQRRLLELVGACLKPGGVAVISYYAGTVPLLMAGLHKVLRANINPYELPQDQIRTARAQIQTIANTLAKQGGDQRLMTAVLQQVYGSNDTIFYHEMLNQSFGALTTSALETALGPRGVHFLNWMQPAPFEDGVSPRARAQMADAFAFAGGGYFYGVFSKTP